jgi:hypothetical protein
VSLDDLMTTTGTLQRKAVTKGEMGGQVPTWADTAYADEPCDLQPSDGKTRLRYEQQGMYCSHLVFLTRDVAARKTDRFAIGSRYFLILGYQPPNDRDDWPAILEVEEQFQ